MALKSLKQESVTRVSNRFLTFEADIISFKSGDQKPLKKRGVIEKPNE